MKKVVCDTCGRDLLVSEESVQFKCPGCMKDIIKRCGKCRKSAVKYICKGCGFTGP